MNFSIDLNNKNRTIEAYGEGYFKINGQQTDKNLLISFEDIDIFEGDVNEKQLISDSLINKILTMKPDILIVGTGKTHIFPDKHLFGTMMNNKIALEVMNTGAACRTFNVLISEDRNCAAILYLE